MIKIIITILLFGFSSLSYAEVVIGYVMDVTSGDKLTIRDNDNVIHRVRLIGIDAPESTQPYGKESRNFLVSLILGKELTVLTSENNQTKILIGKVFLNKKDINLQQISQGMAWLSNNIEKELSLMDQKEYSNAARKAKKNQIGLWRDKCPVEPWIFRQKCCPKQAKGASL